MHLRSTHTHFHQVPFGKVIENMEEYTTMFTMLIFAFSLILAMLLFPMLVIFFILEPSHYVLLIGWLVPLSSYFCHVSLFCLGCLT